MNLKSNHLHFISTNLRFDFMIMRNIDWFISQRIHYFAQSLWSHCNDVHWSTWNHNKCEFDSFLLNQTWMIEINAFIIFFSNHVFLILTHYLIWIDWVEFLISFFHIKLSFFVHIFISYSHFSIVFIRSQHFIYFFIFEFFDCHCVFTIHFIICFELIK